MYRLTSIEQADAVVLVDYSNVAYQAYFGASSTEVRQGLFFTKILNFLDKVHGFPNIALVWAMDQKPTRKLAIYPDYKANRPKRDEDPKEIFKEILSYFKSSKITAEGEEADDVIASFCAKNTDKVIIVYSGDQDLMQLLTYKNLAVIEPLLVQRKTKEDCFKKYGVVPRDLALWKAVFGDPGDNVKPPVARLNKKILVPLVVEAKGDVIAFMSLVKDRASSLKGAAEKLFAAKDHLWMNWRLVNLKRDVPYETIPISPTQEEVSSFMLIHSPEHIFSIGAITGDWAS